MLLNYSRYQYLEWMLRRLCMNLTVSMFRTSFHPSPHPVVPHPIFMSKYPLTVIIPLPHIKTISATVLFKLFSVWNSSQGPKQDFNFVKSSQIILRSKEFSLYLSTIWALLVSVHCTWSDSVLSACMCGGLSHPMASEQKACGRQGHGKGSSRPTSWITRQMPALLQKSDLLEKYWKTHAETVLYSNSYVNWPW